MNATTSSKTTRPATPRPARSKRATRIPVEIDLRDLTRRPAAFFGLSPHATDRATRLTRGPLAYVPV
jgi:hypothetical protein